MVCQITLNFRARSPESQRNSTFGNHMSFMPWRVHPWKGGFWPILLFRLHYLPVKYLFNYWNDSKLHVRSFGEKWFWRVLQQQLWIRGNSSISKKARCISIAVTGSFVWGLMTSNLGSRRPFLMYQRFISTQAVIHFRCFPHFNSRSLTSGNSNKQLLWSFVALICGESSRGIYPLAAFSLYSALPPSFAASSSVHTICNESQWVHDGWVQRKPPM